MNTPELHELIRRIEANVSDGRIPHGVRKMLADTLPHLRRFAKLELMYHAESESHFLSLGVDEGDGLAVPVTHREDEVAAFFETEDDLI